MDTKKKHEYVISHDHVQLELDKLLYSSNPPMLTPLTELTIIEDFLSDASIPRCEQEQEFALHLILMNCIREQFIIHRRAFGLTNPDEYTTQREASVDIATSAYLGGAELIGWAWLYYQYVRVDLYITTTLFNQNACIGPRTLRRYHQHSLRRLTTCLIEYERAARTAQRQRIFINSDLEIFARISDIKRQIARYNDRNKSDENEQFPSISHALVLPDTPYPTQLEARFNFLQAQLQSAQDEHNMLGRCVEELGRQLDETTRDLKSYLREWA